MACLRKNNCFKPFFRESVCPKGRKTHYATFQNRILPYLFCGIRSCVILCILQVWSDYRRARRGFFVLKNSTFLRKCVHFVCFKSILVSCLKAGRRRFPNVQTPAPSRPGLLACLACLLACWLACLLACLLACWLAGLLTILSIWGGGSKKCQKIKLSE